jgi:hypothetical protein
MKNKLLTFLLLLAAFPVLAQNRYTIKLVVTNSPVQGNSYTLNGSTRTFTTNPLVATDMLLTNDINSAASAVWNNAISDPFGTGINYTLNTNTVVFTGGSGVTFTTNGAVLPWAYICILTNAVGTNGFPVLVDASGVLASPSTFFAANSNAIAAQVPSVVGVARSELQLTNAALRTGSLAVTNGLPDTNGVNNLIASNNAANGIISNGESAAVTFSNGLTVIGGIVTSGTVATAGISVTAGNSLTLSGTDAYHSFGLMLNNYNTVEATRSLSGVTAFDWQNLAQSNVPSPAFPSAPVTLSYFNAHNNSSIYSNLSSYDSISLYAGSANGTNLFLGLRVGNESFGTFTADAGSAILNFNPNLLLNGGAPAFGSLGLFGSLTQTNSSLNRGYQTTIDAGGVHVNGWTPNETYDFGPNFTNVTRNGAPLLTAANAASNGVLVNTTGHVWYVETFGTNGASGTQSDPFLSPTNAFAVHNSNDVIRIGSGTFDVGTNQNLMSASNNVAIIGLGHNQTFISCEFTGEVGGASAVMAAPVQNGTLKGFSLVCTNFNLGDVLNNASTKTETTPLQFGNCGYYEDVYVYGVSDCLLNNFITGIGATNTMVNCHFESQWDTFENSNGGMFLECYNTWWVNTNSFYTNAVLERAIALNGRNNTVKLHGGGMLFTNGSSGQIMVGIQSGWAATGANTNSFDLDHISLTFKNALSASNAFAAFISGAKASGKETWILRHVDGFSYSNGATVGTHVFSNADSGDIAFSLSNNAYSGLTTNMQFLSGSTLTPSSSTAYFTNGWLKGASTP